MDNCRRKFVIPALATIKIPFMKTKETADGNPLYRENVQQVEMIMIAMEPQKDLQ